MDAGYQLNEKSWINQIHLAVRSIDRKQNPLYNVANQDTTYPFGLPQRIKHDNKAIL